jgi:urea carboxylase
LFAKVLIANRGVVACRILRTLRRMGIGSVAVFSEADAGSLHVAEADEAVCIGPPAAAASYLDGATLLAAARRTGAEAIHPGYGFLSENADFAERCEASGIVFVGPSSEQIRLFGLKHSSRELARAQGIPLLPGSDLLIDLESARGAAARIGFPVMLKATAGGGGIGMRVCERADELSEAFAAVTRLAGGHFGQGGVFLERFVRQARHIEVQIFGDGHGKVVALGERDCSLQRRNQKVIEETPAPHLPAARRAELIDCAVQLGAAVRYRSAGTVEFLYDAEHDAFYFLEVNTRLQVEHGVTEEVTGIDLVEWMIRTAAGDAACIDRAHGSWSDAARGAAIQARLYAEDPHENFRPSSGVITQARFPAGVRLESWVADGTEVSAHYDPLLAKVIVRAADRAGAVRALEAALDATRLEGLETNLEWLRQVVRSDAFTSGHITTSTLAGLPYRPATIRVVSGGLATTVQDYPGRLGYWHVGVPPSGPMDGLAFRLGNRALGNPADAAALEVTAIGPALAFDRCAVICLAGADFGATLDGRPLEPYTPVAVATGQTLRLGRVRVAGARGYVLFQGGLRIPAYLGSRSTFTLGGFGGHAGRALAAGDVLRLADSKLEPASVLAPLGKSAQPRLSGEWTLRVLYGPHGAPDFFTSEDIDTLLAAHWRVHYNSNRTGVRLMGPKPRWARTDGGEAGLHPSNIHDNAYAVGAVDFTGDMPIILGPDGPSLGGFVCPFVVIQADLWKLGQLAAGNIVRFELVDAELAALEEQAQDAAIEALCVPPEPAPLAPRRAASAVLAMTDARGPRPQAVYRRQGDRHLLVEYGPHVLDLELRLRVHGLMLQMQARPIAGVIDITPGIRSLQIHYDARVLSETTLLRMLAEADDRLGALEDFEIASRVVHLPLSWKDPAVEATIAKYMSSVRADAPWCPDNVEFIRRVNGLDSIDEVRRIVFDARYLVLGLGDVYLGAPVAVPLDPRHRLVTTKYNPARTWTPPNVVGIGGAYLCIYGMEGPGGYQLFGRTVQVWNTYRQTRSFSAGDPWLLRFFDQIRFFPVSHAELEDWRRDFPCGRRDVRIETETFRLGDYRRYLHEHREAIEAFQQRRRAAFEAERADWERRNELSRAEAFAEPPLAEAAIEVPDGADIVEAPLGGNVWKIHVRAGDRIQKGTLIAAIEAMKTECNVPSPAAGIVRAVYIKERQAIAPGAAIIALQSADCRNAGLAEP